MNEKDILDLIDCRYDPDKIIVVNDQYICRVKGDRKGSKLFKEFIKDINSPRMHSFVDASIYSKDEYKKYAGKLCICNDNDLSLKYSISLELREKGNDVPSKIMNVISLSIEDANFSVIEFMKLIKFKPLHEVKEPEDSLGLEVCQFKEHNKHFPSIEFGIDGRIYYEIVDMSNYVEGEVIPLKSDMRKDVIDYVRLSNENAQDIAERINNSLERLYETKI